MASAVVAEASGSAAEASTRERMTTMEREVTLIVKKWSREALSFVPHNTRRIKVRKRGRYWVSKQDGSFDAKGRQTKATASRSYLYKIVFD